MKLKGLPIYKTTILCLIICISFVFTFTACSSNESTSKNAKSTSNENSKEIEKPESVTHVVALKGPTAMGMVTMMDKNENESAPAFSFEIDDAPDQVLPKIIKGEVDIASIPSSMASVLYNKTNGDLKVLAVNTLGVLNIVEKGKTIKKVSDLKGKTIFASGKGTLPEYVLTYILKKNGLKESDVKIEWRSDHTEALSGFLQDGDDAVAMLPQPFASVAQEKSKSIKIALDLTKEWRKIHKNDKTSSLIMGVVVAKADFIKEHPNEVSYFMQEYKKSIKSVKNDPDKVASLIEKYEIAPEKIAKKALPKCNIVYVAGKPMKKQLSGFYQVLYKQNPNILGGKMPASDFYYEKGSE